ncbi:hypothetical protein VULLAG_LOCUS10088 [Vulpes lagopus]
MATHGEDLSRTCTSMLSSRKLRELMIHPGRATGSLAVQFIVSWRKAGLESGA